MVRVLQIFIAMLVSLFFFIPLLTLTFGLSGVSLSGVTKKELTSRLSVATLLNQKFQSHFEKVFFESTGLLGYLVRTDNQMNYFAFRQISSNPRSPVLLGNKNQLMERPYLDSANRVGKDTPARMQKTALNLSRLQDALHEQGLPLLLVISPNKPTFYPETVPAWYRIADRESRTNSRIVLRAELEKRGVPVLDAFELLKEKEKELQQRMFASSGTHWNQLGGCLVASEIMRRADQMLPASIPQIECAILGERETPVFPDTDLLRVANLWFPDRLKEPAPIVKTIGHIRSKSAARPKFLLIGSSFVWELLRQFEAGRVVQKTEFLYYFKRRVINSADQGRKIDRSRFNYQQAFDGKSLVIIEINQASLRKASFGFARSYLQTLNQKPKE